MPWHSLSPPIVAARSGDSSVRVRELELRIRKAMTQQKKERISGNGWEASCRSVEVCRFDVSAFRADHSKLYRAYTRPLTVSRFSISAAEGEPAAAAANDRQMKTGALMPGTDPEDIQTGRTGEQLPN